jgi:hypothetical protein
MSHWLTYSDGGKGKGVRVSALRPGRRFTPQKHFYFCLWYSFLFETA